MKKCWSLLVVLSFLALPVGAFALTPDELAAQSEAAAAASAGTKPTVDLIKQKVTDGCELLKKEGLAGFAKFQGADSAFIFAGTYIWIHDMEGVMRMHPIKYKMNGKNLLSLKDSNGKRFFAEMNRVAGENSDGGWVDYMWPKPGEKAPSMKVSFVKACPVEGQTLVLGAGVYGLTKEDIAK